MMIALDLRVVGQVAHGRHWSWTIRSRGTKSCPTTRKRFSFDMFSLKTSSVITCGQLLRATIKKRNKQRRLPIMAKSRTRITTVVNQTVDAMFCCIFRKTQPPPHQSCPNGCWSSSPWHYVRFKQVSDTQQTHIHRVTRPMTNTTIHCGNIITKLHACQSSHNNRRQTDTSVTMLVEHHDAHHIYPKQFVSLLCSCESFNE